MNPTWLLEEIPVDSIDTWLNAFAVNLNPYSKTDLAQKRSMRIKAFIRPGDRLVHYSTPAEYWDQLAGQDGIIILRHCCIIESVILLEN